ncbi:MAG: hypothetical protein HKN19_12965 [Halioglobus sp.]|nr:hypothetical protein [Halioglobus sp.]
MAVSTAAREDIAQLIPHSGAMCLLERVEAYSDGEISCWAKTHTDPDNPLRNASGLPASAGVEYAAQAMALHGALCNAGAGKPRVGYIAVLSRVVWHRARLDDLPGELRVNARRLAVNDAGSSYAFDVSCEGESVVSGQALVALQA